MKNTCFILLVFSLFPLLSMSQPDTISSIYSTVKIKGELEHGIRLEYEFKDSIETYSEYIWSDGDWNIRRKQISWFSENLDTLNFVDFTKNNDEWSFSQKVKQND